MPSTRSALLFFASACLATVACAPAFAQIKPDDISAAVKDLGSGDRDRVAAGRTTLLSLLNVVRSNQPALSSFAHDVAGALMPVASGNDPHARLNAALVVQRVADQSGATSLLEICAKLSMDDSAAVSAYGLRATSSVLPHLLADPKADAEPLINAVLAAAKNHADSEAVLSESYGAITRVLLDAQAVKLLGATEVTTATPRAVDAVQKLLAMRIAEFGSGTVAEPAAEQPAISFLGKANTYNLSSPAQRITTMRLLLKIMDAAATEIGAGNMTGPTGRLRLDALRNIAKGAGGGLSVIATLMSKPELQISAGQSQQFGLATPVNEYKRIIGLIQNDFYQAIPELRPPATQPAAS